jgi:hypothetical protein
MSAPRYTADFVRSCQTEVADRKRAEFGAHEAPKASVGVHAIGSLRTLKLMLTRTEQPVLALSADRSA